MNWAPSFVIITLNMYLNLILQHVNSVLLKFQFADLSPVSFRFIILRLDSY